jgi:hypothetical protein
VEVVISESDDWTEDRIEQPAIGAGAAFPDRTIADLLSHSDWRARLGAQGYVVGVLEDLPRVYRTRYLGELPSKGATLDAQARWLARWAEDAILGLAALAPPPDWPLSVHPAAS